jgi:hypothetical protein
MLRSSSDKLRRDQSGLYRVIVVLLFLPVIFSACAPLAPRQPQTGSLIDKASKIQEEAIDKIVAQVLQDQNTNGWDEQHHGLLINWRRDDPLRINCSGRQCDARGGSTRHDIANDLRDLQNLYWYKSRHPGDTSMDKYIAQILPTVKARWGHTSDRKGWIYFTLLRLATYSGEPAYWNEAARHWAQVQYQKIDPQLGIHHGKVQTVAGGGSETLQDAYRVDHELEVGVALLDAGKRYQQPGWVSAGLRAVDVVTRQAFDPTYHLFSRIYLINDLRYGKNRVFDAQARMGEQGQIIEMLLHGAAYSESAAFVDLAVQMLDALQASPVRDMSNGGFYFSILVGEYKGKQAGYVSSQQKETRQLHLLSAVHQANKLRANRWASMEEGLLKLATASGYFFQTGLRPGYPYHLLANWSLYPCKTCKPAPDENWISAEANNIALEALQTVISS